MVKGGLTMDKKDEQVITDIKVDVEMVVKFSYRGVGKVKDFFVDDVSIGVFMETETSNLLTENGLENVDACITDLRVERREI
jgi:hypothetical protein